jgi:predicted AlkP superfamily phosphohydrolase/phosphomutase
MPGTHGIFDFVRGVEGPSGMVLKLYMSYDILCETLWSIVNRHGGTITSLNYLLTYPPEPVAGYCVPGFLNSRHIKMSLHPPELYAILKSIPGFNAKELSFDMNGELEAIRCLPPEQYSSWIAAHIRREQQLFNIARHLLQTRPTDLTAIVFDGIDKLQHLCWRFLDPELKPSAPTALEMDIIRNCYEYFRLVDQFIGEICTITGPDTRIFLASDHGFCASQEVFYVNAWLASQGYLRWNAEHEHTAHALSSREIKTHLATIDWNGTKAYALTPSGNGIFIRTKAGATGGGVADHESELLRKELIEKITAISSPFTGRRIVKHVLIREETFAGLGCSRAPDLTLLLEDNGFVETLNADSVVKPRQAVGTHHPTGIFAACGQGIPEGAILERHSIIDVAPTLLYSLGIPIPEDIDGRAALDTFSAAFVERRPIAFGPKTMVPSRDSHSHPTVGEADVIELLKALDYVRD